MGFVGFGFWESIVECFFECDFPGCYSLPSHFFLFVFHVSCFFASCMSLLVTKRCDNTLVMCEYFHLFCFLLFTRFCVAVFFVNFLLCSPLCFFASHRSLPSSIHCSLRYSSRLSHAPRSSAFADLTTIQYMVHLGLELMNNSVSLNHNSFPNHPNLAVAIGLALFEPSKVLSA